MTKKILSIIPARGGSKGVPRKNTADLNGKPLIAWSIEASINSKYITKTVVSSDDEEILSISKKYGAEIIRRPGDLARDDSSSEVVVSHAIDFLKLKGEEFDFLVLLQPTSPLRTSDDIDSSFDILFNSNATAVISVYEVDNKILKAFKKNKYGYIEGIANDKYPFMRRQDLPCIYMSNGAIYVIKVDRFIKNNSFFTSKTIPYEMSGTNSMDIDTKEDLEEIRKRMT
ncbi:acylneuraminate cytidylyltransferase family protein [bacterium]|jgi:CMP-N-acetylneuraminic acid synthetase|nr:acylneuraminate cytidylyltransferase family protein [bacterium]